MDKPVVLITGATSGIGEATARALAPDHAVVLVGRRTERLAALVRELTALGGHAWGITADVTGDDVPRKIIAETISKTGRLDALVNNAGIFATAGIGSMTPEHIQQVLAIDLIAPMLLTQAAIPHLRGVRGGTVVQVSSVAAEVNFTGCGVYAAAKAGFEAWSRCVREELRGTGVRISVIAPGATDTDIWPPDAPCDRTRMCRAADVAAAIRAAITMPMSASIDRITVTPPGGPL